MKNLKARFLALCGLLVLVAASVAPLMVSAQTPPTCPTQTVNCGSKIRHCTGTVNGDRCEYDRSCLNCGGGDGGEVAPVEGPVQ